MEMMEARMISKFQVCMHISNVMSWCVSLLSPGIVDEAEISAVG